MGLFSKARVPERVAVAASESAAGTQLLDAALDSLGAVIRVLGRVSFDTDERDADAFARECDAWARHVLVGTALPPDESGAEPVLGAGRRAWHALIEYVTAQRQDEQTYVRGRESSFKGVIFELIDGFRVLNEDSRATDLEVEQKLSRLEHAARDSSLEALRRLVPEVLGEIRSSLEQRQSLLRSQMETMGASLRALREDLLTTRRQLELDALTGVYNRGALEATLSRFIDLAVFSGEAAALFMVDLDHFKHVNDRFGHAAGDESLRLAAKTIVRTFPRKDDFVARYGGDEFVVLLHLAQEADADRLAERLLDNLRGVCLVRGDETIRCTCSIGYSHPVVGDSATDLLERADAALYQAKLAGRDRAMSARALAASAGDVPAGDDGATEPSE